MLINVNHTIYIQYFHKLLKTLNKKKIIKKVYIYNYTFYEGSNTC